MEIFVIVLLIVAMICMLVRHVRNGGKSNEILALVGESGFAWARNYLYYCPSSGFVNISIITN